MELRTIYFVQNKISHITGFEDVGRTLRSLELGGNRIRVRTRPNLCTRSIFEYLMYCRKSRDWTHLSTSKSCGSGRTRSRSLRLVAKEVRVRITLTLHQNLGTLKSLKILSIQSNRILKLEGIEDLENLEELYLSHNGIEKMEGLEHNVSVFHRIGHPHVDDVVLQHKLRTLDIGNNYVAELEGISHLTQLEELWVSYCRFPQCAAH